MENNAYKRYLDGDDTALLDLIREFKKPLTMYLNSYVRDLNTADELCYETFVRLAYKRPIFSGRSSFKTFLFGIGRNVALSYLRKSKRGNCISLEEAEEISDDSDLEKAYLTKEQNRIIYSAIDNLKSEFAQAIWLMYFEDMSVKEISHIMKRSESAVKVLLHRARTALKAELEKEGYVYEND